MKTKISLLTATLILSGCLATTNLLNEESSLNSFEKSIANEIAHKTTNMCIRYSYDTSSGRKLSGNMKIQRLPEIKRFFISDSGWYKAYLNTEGIWDNMYYHPKNFKFICGDKSWSEYADSNAIVFQELGVSIKKLEAAPSMINFKSEKSKSIEEKLKNLRELREKNLITEKQYDEQVKKVLE
jgi:hypothetical protein